jgi:LacI family transcriptional regulator
MYIYSKSQSVKRKKISIVEIAKKLKVSPTTISFVLNGKAKEQRVSDKVVKKIEAYVSKTGYKPNSFAQSLRTGKSKLIGLMIEDISNPFFANVARLIEDKAYENGYRIMYCSTNNNIDKAKAQIKMFRDCHVDGYIIAATNGIEEDIKKLIAENEKVVLFDRHFDEIKVDSIVVNNEESCYQAVMHFSQNGFRNIAFITTDQTQLQMIDRLNGYKKAIRKIKAKSFITKIDYNHTTEEIIEKIKIFLCDHRVDAVLFATNYLGVYGLEAIHELKYKIPKDIGIIAFDDHVLFQLYNPPVSAIEQPIELISDAIISRLLGRLNENADETVKTESAKIEIPTALIERKSSQAK